MRVERPVANSLPGEKEENVNGFKPVLSLFCAVGKHIQQGGIYRVYREAGRHIQDVQGG